MKYSNKKKQMNIHSIFLECMLIYGVCTQYLVGAPFALFTVSIRHGMEMIRLWHC